MGFTYYIGLCIGEDAQSMYKCAVPIDLDLQEQHALHGITVV